MGQCGHRRLVSLLWTLHGPDGVVTAPGVLHQDKQSRIPMGSEQFPGTNTNTPGKNHSSCRGFALKAMAAIGPLPPVN